MSAVVAHAQRESSHWRGSRASSEQTSFYVCSICSPIEVKTITSATLVSEGDGTMDESRPSANLIKMWVDTQQQLLTNWFDTMRGLGGTPSLATWRQTVEAWQ